MSASNNNGGPAFLIPGFTYQNGELEYPQSGMSLRDYFAAHENLQEFDHPDASMSQRLGEALAGEPQPKGGWSGDPLPMFQWEAKWRAALKYIRADAMVTARLMSAD